MFEAAWTARALDLAERLLPDVVIASEPDLCRGLRSGEPGRTWIATSRLEAPNRVPPKIRAAMNPRAYSQPMAEQHRVAGHLGVSADDYDRTIREFIPHYERMLATVVHWLDGHVPPEGLVVDLGAGTGSLSAAILDALPTVRVELVDVDPNMLEVAATRCADHVAATSCQMDGSRTSSRPAMPSSPRSRSTTS